MCGIAGWLDSDIDFYEKQSVLQNMQSTLKRRGPDENGIKIYRGAALIHSRLAVIDIENGKQPMTVQMGEKSYTIVYNGELYNTQELRRTLENKGYSFIGHSDTEVVLKAYVHWGKSCADMLNGIFAFAVYEESEKTLFLCRDKIGVKPLFYHTYNGGIIFGSEIKTLLASQKVKPVIDENGLYEIFFLGPARTMGNGIFKGISELCNGEYLLYKDGIITKQKYYHLTAKPHTDSEGETIEKTRFLLTDAIERQLTSDVPLCFFLSGGLDSSVITKTASEYYKKHNKGAIHTYSVEYKDNMRYFKKSLFQPNADVEYISMMVNDTNSVHNEVIIDNESLADALYDAVIARDLPGMADVDSSLLLFCKSVKQKYTVALSGECADELFGGYPWYHNKDILFEDCFPWSRSQDIRKSILKNAVLPKGEEYVREKYLDTIKSVPKLSNDSKETCRMREMFMLNFKWFMQCLLDRKDRCSMYSGLEVRVPFCDYRIVDYAFNMPWELKAYNSREKGIVRKAFENILPYEICYRKKSPYPKTHNPIYTKIVSDRVTKILEKKTQLNELLSKSGILEIIENPDNISSPWYGQLMRAPQILAYIIQLDFWFERYKVEIDM